MVMRIGRAILCSVIGIQWMTREFCKSAIGEPAVWGMIYGMIQTILSNYIAYMAQMSIEILCAGVCAAGLITVLAVVIGWPLALVVSECPVGVRYVVSILCVPFLLMPPLVPAIRVYGLLANGMIMGRGCSAIIALVSAGLVEAAIVSMPITFLVSIYAVRQVDPETVLAARTLGIRRSVIRRKVILPQASSRIMVGTILTFVRACGAFMAAAMILQTEGLLEGTVEGVVAGLVQEGIYLNVLLWTALVTLAGVLLILVCGMRHRRQHRKPQT